MKNFPNWLSSIILILLVIPVLSSCTCCALKSYDGGLFTFLVAVWIMAIGLLIAHTVGAGDDVVGGFHEHYYKVGQGEWKTIRTYNPEETRTVKGTGSEERGREYMLVFIYIFLFVVQFFPLKAMIGDAKNIIYVLLAVAIFIELACLSEFINRNLLSIKYIAISICAIDLVIGGVIIIFKWLF